MVDQIASGKQIGAAADPAEQRLRFAGGALLRR
jgi:hypothetical protein